MNGLKSLRLEKVDDRYQNFDSSKIILVISFGLNARDADVQMADFMFLQLYRRCYYYHNDSPPISLKIIEENYILLKV